MNTTLPKLFACKSSGCNLNFTSEDHLNMHTKKHEMKLTIENKGSASVFLVDQTPTPTKLIKNCEEVGLFEDLRHVNPFDETFRRAVETKTNLNITNHNTESKILILNEDTLHTPQVFRHDESNNNCQDFRIDKEKIILSTNIADKKRKTLVNEVAENSNKSIRRQNSLTEVVLKTNSNKNSKTSQSPRPLSVSTKPSPILPNTINLIQPQNITWQPTQKLILPKPSTVTLNCDSPEKNTSVKEKLKSIITKNDTSEPSVNKPNEQIIKQKKRTADCLERRKAAAARYRKNKHIQQCDLQKRNVELLAENLELKSKLKQLQEVLLAHRNCDLTKNAINNSPNGITAQLLMKNVPLIQIPASTIIMKIPKLLIKPGDIQL